MKLVVFLQLIGTILEVSGHYYRANCEPEKGQKGSKFIFGLCGKRFPMASHETFKGHWNYFQVCVEYGPLGATFLFPISPE